MITPWASKDPTYKAIEYAVQPDIFAAIGFFPHALI